MNNSEEDIKQKVIMPFLKSIGFEENELKFEKSFSIRAGRYTFNVNTDKQIKSISPRLDILVTRDGNNLFVIEAKTDASVLTEEDKEQAISYARLIHPMAPIAIVTNGKEFKLYKTLDKSEIENNDKASILDYKLSEDIKDIYDEALEYFIGYSQNNVKNFCDVQIKEGMKTLLGSRDDKNKKFIPELYVPSKKLAQHFDNFINNDKSVFALVGESGSGKTCSMCGLSRDLSKKYPVLFYRAIDLIHGPLKAIADDFNWEFSAHYDEIKLIKRLNKIFKDRKIIIFIDGLDEWINPEKVEIIGNFASNIKDKNFKIIVSCKSEPWEAYLIKQGIPTSLSEEIFSSEKSNKAYIVAPFEDDEFFEAIKKYRAFYDFKGLFESDVLSECKRTPFLLRVFFEVAFKTKSPHLTFSIKEFYEEYYRTILDKLPDSKETAESTVKSVARILFENNTDAVDIDIVRKELELDVSTLIMPSLFECNILEKTTNDSGTYIEFYFKKIRDYIIAFKVKRWHTVTDIQFREEVESLNISKVQLDAVSFYYEFADIEKKRIIDGQFRANAIIYLDFYTKILGENFPDLKHRFDPHTNNLIGFVGELSIQHKMLRFYGFRAINENKERIKFIIAERGLLDKDSNHMYLLGANRMHHRGLSANSSENSIKKEVLEYDVIDQLEKIINDGLLNETNNYYLSLEIILGVIFNKQKEIHQIKRTGKLIDYLPISIEKVEYGIRYQKACKYYEDELMKKKIESGEIKVKKSGSIHSCSYSRTPEDWKIVHSLAEQAALSGKEIEYKEINFNKSEKIIKDAISIVKKKKDVIDESLLPSEYDLSMGCCKYNKAWRKDKTLVTDYLQRFYKIFLQEYHSLIETNFPTLKHRFSLYSVMPVHFFIVINLNDDVYLQVYNCHSNNTKNEATVCFENEFVFDDDKFSFHYNENNYKVISISYLCLNDLLNQYREFISIDIPSEFTILRNLIYKEVSDDLTAISEYLLQEYAITAT